ncbi:hypothetical protein [Polaribacter staleyi]|uniref:hypothetical protein n=1 Tax=Polaribacter staleyi TaxID=2022337 RepID=UPI0031BA2643
MKKRIEIISSLIEVWFKEKIVFACALLPFGTVGEATHTLHTFANRTSLRTDQNLQKSAFFTKRFHHSFEQKNGKIYEN